MPESRTHIIQAHLEATGVEAALITFLPDVRWISGFTGSNGALVILKNEAHFFSDGRYLHQAQKEVSGAEVHITSDPLLAFIAQSKILRQVKSVLIQSDHLSVQEFQNLKSLLPETNWDPVADFLNKDVARKSEDEINLIKQAQRVTELVFEAILGKIRPGVTELDIAAEIVYEHLRLGAEKMSFDPIVASGVNGSLPHARPTPKKIMPGEMVVLDFGCIYEGYASDMTRTVAIGEPGEEARFVYDVVLKAQENALLHARAGMLAKELDGAARSIIEAADFGEFFTHSLGHGVGLQIHEWPKISRQAEELLPENAVVTIEPGIYMPGKFGVRIEDMIILREDGSENLTSSPKELICI